MAYSLLCRAFAEHHRLINNYALLQSGRALLDLIDTMEGAPEILPPAIAKKMFDLYYAHARCAKLAGARLVSKTHYLLHCFSRSVHTGNPTSFAFFFDESLNKSLAATCRGAYSVHFEKRVLEFFQVWKCWGLGEKGQSVGSKSVEIVWDGLSCLETWVACSTSR